MRQGSKFVPAINIDADKNRFQEKRKSFQREWQADHAAEGAHEFWPQQAKFEGQDGSRNSTDSKQHRKRFGPSLRQRLVNSITGFQKHAFRGQHQNRQANAKAGQDDMKSQRKRHLDPGGKQLFHSDFLAKYKSLVTVSLQAGLYRT